MRQVPVPGHASDDEARFREVFTRAHGDLTQFVRRRIAEADDIVAETFLIAWRRLQDVPREFGDARAWLFTVARNLMANQRCKDARLVAWNPGREVAQSDHSPATDVRLDLARAFASLTASDRECLVLVAWDGGRGGR